MEKNPQVDEFIEKANQWQQEFKKLRAIILETNLTEEFKWKVPCYSYEGSNVVLIHGFKEYCAILFIKGSLLHDSNSILVQQTVNVQAGRQIRFKSVNEILELETILKSYIDEAIEIEKSGRAVDYKKNTDFLIPEELQVKFEEISTLKKAFSDLTPGRQRAYILYFSQPKQTKTREARVQKYLQQILDGKGLND
jgi:uncharacterized protein YdeI (YjbR/CyaY-like superfamily)